MADAAGTNWAGTYAFAGTLHRPASLDELRAIVARAPRVHVLGSRHSFNAIADSAELVSLDGLPADVTVDHEAGTVSCSAALTYGELAAALAAEGVALHNLASLPHISVARRGGHRDARLGRRQRQPGHGGQRRWSS